MQQNLRSLVALMALAGPLLIGAIDPGVASAQEGAPLLLKVDLVVPAATEGGQGQADTTLCVDLPDTATTVTAGRRALVPEAGVDRPLLMTIRPYASTANPLVERLSIPSESLATLTLPELGYEICFSFEHTVAQAQARSVAQAYKYFAQIVTLEVR